MRSERLTLGIDTAGPHCAAAVLCGERVLASRHEDMARGQAERLMGLLTDVLGDAGAVWADLDGLGVGTGPGNFTGLRISVAAVRGLALSLGCPAYGVSRFECLGAELGTDARRWLLATPAPRGQFYVQGWQNAATEGRPGLIDPLALPEWLGAETAGVYGEEASSLADALCVPFRPAALPPIATAIALHVARARATGRAPDCRPAPLYVRPADAAPSNAARVMILQ